MHLHDSLSLSPCRTTAHNSVYTSIEQDLVLALSIRFQMVYVLPV